MKKILCTLSLLFGFALPPTAAAQEESAKQLQSYSVGERRTQIESEKVVIERPKFDNDFKMDMPKPSMSAMQIAKPNLEIVTGPRPPDASASNVAPQGTRTASAGATPAVNTPPGTGETRAVRPLQMDAPSYPRDAFLRRDEGHVIVEFTINTQGQTEDVTVVESQPRGTFDREAQRAVTRWKFEPALRDGRPVSQRIRHTLEFKLDGK